MADKTTPIPQMSVAQSDPSAFVNGINDAASPSMLYGRNMLTTIGLTFGYLGGRFNGNTIATGTVSLTNGATNYIVADRTTGAVSVATNTTNWDNVADYMQLHTVVTASGIQADWNDLRQAYGVQGGGGGSVTQCIAIACSDETTALTTGTAKATFRMPFAFTLTAVRASLTAAQASGSIFTVDINEGGTTILSTKITIDNTEKSSATAATPPVISDASLADDAEITVDIDQIGSGSAAGLKIYLIGHQ